jgi:hypothetical protein
MLAALWAHKQILDLEGTCQQQVNISTVVEWERHLCLSSCAGWRRLWRRLWQLNTIANIRTNGNAHAKMLRAEGDVRLGA